MNFYKIDFEALENEYVLVEFLSWATAYNFSLDEIFEESENPFGRGNSYIYVRPKGRYKENGMNYIGVLKDFLKPYTPKPIKDWA